MNLQPANILLNMHWSARLDLVLSLSVLAQIPYAFSFRVPLLSDELGCSPTLSILLSNNGKASPVKNQSKSLYYFDPFNLATDSNFSRYREAEYKHGRVAMLAMSEIILAPIIKQFSVFTNLSNMNGELNSKTVQPPDHAIAANLLNLRLDDILPVIVTCGLLEVFVFVQQDAKDMPGDYGVGYFGLRNKGLHEQQLVMELEHGRLAMIGFVIYMLIDATTTYYQEVSWLDQWYHLIRRIPLPQ